jgi:hypothetical protein
MPISSVSPKSAPTEAATLMATIAGIVIRRGARRSSPGRDAAPRSCCRTRATGT